jgi:hypothetical protein
MQLYITNYFGGVLQHSDTKPEIRLSRAGGRIIIILDTSAVRIAAVSIPKKIIETLNHGQLASSTRPTT